MDRRCVVTQFQLLLSEARQDVLVFGMSGELDLGTVRPLKEAAETASANGYRTLVFDLTRLDFIDSSGLHVLAGAQRAMKAKQGDAYVVCSSANLMRIFELTGLDHLLTIVPTRDAALAGVPAAA